MTMGLGGEAVLVIGASKGIGQGRAIGMAEADVLSTVNYKTGAAETCEQIRRSSGQTRLCRRCRLQIGLRDYDRRGLRSIRPPRRAGEQCGPHPVRLPLNFEF